MNKKNYYYLPTSSLFFKPANELLRQIQFFDKQAFFIILSISLSDSEKEFLKNHFSCQIVQMPQELRDKISFNGRWPKELFFKYFLPWFLAPDVDKIVSLGADMVVQKDISGLFKIDMENYPIAACIEEAGNLTNRFSLFNSLPEDKVYVNAELMLINLNYFRSHYSIDELIDSFLKIGKECKIFEQDFLNYFFYGKIKILRSAFNFQIYEHWRTPEFKEWIKSSYVIHFSINPKPWMKDSSYRLTKIYYPFVQNENFKKEIKILMAKEIVKAPFLIALKILRLIKKKMK